jgi:anti-sigma factor RsiW
MSTEQGDRHYAEELQDLLDRRLDSDREREIRAHLGRCLQCRREFEALVWVKGVAAAATEADLPAGIERSIRDALAREDRPRVSRRVLMATAASLLVGTAGAAWLFRRSRGSLPATVARDYERLRSGTLPLEAYVTRSEGLEAFFLARGISFRTRVLDLVMMRYQIEGGRVHTLGGRPSAFFVYKGDGGRTLVCQMYPGRLDELPPADEVREHRGFRFQIYRQQGVTVVFWQEGETVCVLAGDFGEQEVVALAFEKAML